MRRAKGAARARARARGAAMVEGIVIITVMLVFIGMIMFAHDSYARKIDLQTSTRSTSLFFASHACDGGAPDAVTSQGQSAEFGADTRGLEGTTSRLRNSERAGASRDWGIARSEQTAEVNGSAIVDLRRTGLHRRVGAKSAVACNERSYDNRWTGLIPFAIEFARRGGGVVDLFQ
jgi:hypothetical protein